MIYQFTISTPIKPYVRMTRRGKWTDPEAQAYIASQTAIGLQIKQQMTAQGWDMLPVKTPLRLEVAVTVPGRLYTMDADNLLKAVADALQGTAFKNDLWIVEARVTKAIGSDHLTLIEVGTIETEVTQ